MSEPYQMPPPKRGRPPGPPKPKPEPPPPDSRPLLDRVLQRYGELRARDATIKRLEREMSMQKAVIRRAQQLRKLAEGATRNHEGWLKREAAAQIGKEAGVQTIPGFVGRSESAMEYRRRIRQKQDEAHAAAQILIAARGQPA
jgi:hypothetical protein